jgi:hypothetical protein
VNPPKISGGFNAPLQQASLSQNAQWRSQKPFKPFVDVSVKSQKISKNQFIVIPAKAGIQSFQ